VSTRAYEVKNPSDHGISAARYRNSEYPTPGTRLKFRHEVT